MHGDTHEADSADGKDDVLHELTEPLVVGAHGVVVLGVKIQEINGNDV